ncbi:hypothetical protein IPA_08640 [Ignicoccus pacificus DSM 13166]|uniref:Uncharacterized protein n=1 Tax=Ignicoccus pacificus DSM 13166 TaxID=940294 RepID=A0A977PLU0_9CREN|nr:hypothetical protein IPA_08640 [Ignicoccus pacificus DSM 13166]
MGTFDDGKFSERVCPVVTLITEGWPPKIDSISLSIFKKDPGNLTEPLSNLLEDVSLIIIDSITICGLGYVDPEGFGPPVIVVSKYVPNIRKAYKASRELYGNDEFVRISEKYLERVRCFPRREGRICIASYGLDLFQARKIVEERTLVEPLPEEVRMAHEVASAIGRWLNHP